MQVLVLKRRPDGLWALPGSFREPDCAPLPVVSKVFGVGLEQRFRALNRFLLSGELFYQVRERKGDVMMREGGDRWSSRW